MKDQKEGVVLEQEQNKRGESKSPRHTSLSPSFQKGKEQPPMLKSYWSS